MNAKDMHALLKATAQISFNHPIHTLEKKSTSERKVPLKGKKKEPEVSPPWNQATYTYKQGRKKKIKIK